MEQVCVARVLPAPRVTVSDHLARESVCHLAAPGRHLAHHEVAGMKRGGHQKRSLARGVSELSYCKCLVCEGHRIELPFAAVVGNRSAAASTLGHHLEACR